MGMRNINKDPLAKRRGRRGGAATELAILMPVMITLVLGCTDFGRFAYYHIALANAVRAGAAYAMINPPSSYTSPPSSWQTSIQTAVSNEMSHVPGYQSGSLTVSTVTPVSNGDGTYRFTVSATYQFQTLFHQMGATFGVPSSLTLPQSVTMRFTRS
jgi:Flp pilus assembly protein TadG